MKNKKKIIIIASIVVFILAIISTIILVAKTNKKENITKDEINNLYIAEKLEYEINTEVKNTELLDSEKNEKEGFIIITEEENLDTSKLGENTYKFEYKDKTEQERQQEVVYNIVDTTKPEIEVEENISITIGESFDINKYAKVSDNSNEELEIKIVGEYDINKVGEYTIKLTAEDSSKNKIEKEIKLIVKEKEQQKASSNNTNSNKTTSSSNKTNSNKNNSATNETTSSNNNSSNNSINTPASDKNCIELPVYSITDEWNFNNNTCMRIYKITYTGYITTEDENGNYELGFGTDVTGGSITIPYVKKYFNMPSEDTLRQVARERYAAFYSADITNPILNWNFNAGTFYVVMGKY